MTGIAFAPAPGRPLGLCDTTDDHRRRLVVGRRLIVVWGAVKDVLISEGSERWF
jgi:hypothetical protein